MLVLSMSRRCMRLRISLIGSKPNEVALSMWVTAKGCDLMIHDAMFLDGQESLAAVTHHSTARDAGSAAKVARARRLVLTHISPGNEGAEKKYLTQASAVFDGRIVLAKDLQTLTV